MGWPPIAMITATSTATIMRKRAMSTGPIATTIINGPGWWPASPARRPLPCGLTLKPRFTILMDERAGLMSPRRFGARIGGRVEGPERPLEKEQLADV